MKKLSKMSVMLFLISFAILISISFVSAASTVYVNTTGGNDSNNGSIDHPYKTIGKGINATDENGTVQIADGIYSEENNTNITINKSITITGQSQSKTIINGTGTSWIFHINSGINVTIQNLTVINGSFDDGGAIYNAGNLTISRCTFINNTATSYCGGAIFNDGNLIVSGSTFTDNTAPYWGGAICNGGTLNISDTVFANNTAQDKSWGVGGAIYNYGSLSISGSVFKDNNASEGGAIYNSGNGLTVSGSVFKDNNASEGGAIYNYYDRLNVTKCTFTGNNANTGGAIYNYGGDITSNIVKFSRIIGNTGNYDIYSDSGTLNAENNWWGTNFQGTNPQSAGRVNNKVYADPWIMLSMSADPTITNTGNSNASANLRYNSNGVDTSSLGAVPDAPVSFEVDANGNLNPLSGIISNGQSATTLFTATHKGKATINATVDGFTLSQLITISNISPVVTGDSKTTKENTPVNGSVTATDADGDTLTYTLGTRPSHGNVTVNSNGNYIYTPNSNWYGIDTFTIAVNDGNGGTATATVTITVNQAIADLYIKINSSNKNPKIGDTFLLTYKLGNNGPDEAKNVTITFQLPEGLEFVNIGVDEGKYTYNKTTRTVTWTLDSVPVGDPYLYLTVKAEGDGTYKIIPSVFSATYNSGSIGGITINVLSNSNENTVNAASKTTKTIELQETGLPLNYLILSIFIVLSGLITSKKF